MDYKHEALVLRELAASPTCTPLVAKAATDLADMYEAVAEKAILTAEAHLASLKAGSLHASGQAMMEGLQRLQDWHSKMVWLSGRCVLSMKQLIDFANNKGAL